MTDFAVGSVYATTENSLFKCVSQDGTNAVLLNLTTFEALHLPILQTSAWFLMSPDNSDDAFTTGSIVRDYYSGATYVVLNTMKFGDTTLVLSLLRPTSGLGGYVVEGKENLLPSVSVDVVEPWPAWLGQQVTVPSNNE